MAIDARVSGKAAQTAQVGRAAVIEDLRAGCFRVRFRPQGAERRSGQHGDGRGDGDRDRKGDTAASGAEDIRLAANTAGEAIAEAQRRWPQLHFRTVLPTDEAGIDVIGIGEERSGYSG